MKTFRVIRTDGSVVEFEAEHMVAASLTVFFSINGPVYSLPSDHVLFVEEVEHGPDR